ncbi:ACT domain-containing protein [uncultured Sphaerochaeta sp.]|uniref:ACT domain-containing protein n=1 Tax=uncultured Sphaerochaeta sp. TaxID=886478 RepID=UPI002A0A1D77|nr:ACT domain-containing protein [uncultured Sphaerochaeta sp.]
MELTILDNDFCICQVSNLSEIDTTDSFCFIAKTLEEISVVCSVSHAPKNPLARDDGWKGFKVAGILDFSLVGILAKLSNILAENSIPLFAVSTFATDYILVKGYVLRKSTQGT